MQEVNFEEAIERILAKDARYERDAYLFLRDSLDHTQRQIARQAKGPVRHVTPPELLEGIREYALQQFGPMTLTVLGEWGVHTGEDFGEIVFNMIETGLLAKTDKDHRADFAGVYEFDAAFRRPFLPASKLTTPKPEVKPASA